MDFGNGYDQVQYVMVTEFPSLTMDGKYRILTIVVSSNRPWPSMVELASLSSWLLDFGIKIIIYWQNIIKGFLLRPLSSFAKWQIHIKKTHWIIESPPVFISGGAENIKSRCFLCRKSSLIPASSEPLSIAWDWPICAYRETPITWCLRNRWMSKRENFTRENTIHSNKHEVLLQNILLPGFIFAPFFASHKSVKSKSRKNGNSWKDKNPIISSWC